MKKILIMFSILFLALFFSGGQVLAAKGEIIAQMYEQGSNKTKKLYDYHNSWDDQSINVEIKDGAGLVAVTEKAQLNGSQLLKYEIDQKQIKSKGTIEVKDGRIYFTKDVDGKIKTDDEKLGKSLVVSSNFPRVIKDHWSEFLENKDVDIRFAVWDRLETVGFTLSNQGTEEIDGRKCVKIKMKASSIIIAAIVRPLYLYFTEDGAHLVKLDGRVAPKKKNGDHWDDLDAEVYYRPIDL
jgi:hypothetical protein